MELEANTTCYSIITYGGKVLRVITRNAVTDIPGTQPLSIYNLTLKFISRIFTKITPTVPPTCGPQKESVNHEHASKRTRIAYARQPHSIPDSGNVYD